MRHWLWREIVRWPPSVRASQLAEMFLIVVAALCIVGAAAALVVQYTETISHTAPHRDDGHNLSRTSRRRSAMCLPVRVSASLAPISVPTQRSKLEIAAGRKYRRLDPRPEPLRT